MGLLEWTGQGCCWGRGILGVTEGWVVDGRGQRVIEDGMKVICSSEKE